MKPLRLRSPLPDPFVLLALGVLCGYLFMSRSFAHWGIRPLYVGEMALGALLIGRPNSMLKPWLGSMTTHSCLTAFSWWFGVSVAYGLLECLGVVLGGPVVMQMAEIMAFSIYPIWFFTGAWIGLRHPDILARYIVPVAWLHGIYGLGYVTLLSPEMEAHAYHEATHIDWFSFPEGCAIMMLGLLAFERNPRRAAIPMILNLIVMFGMQRRAEWIAFMLAAVLWAVLAGRVKRVMQYGFVLSIPLLIGLIPGVKFPSPDVRGQDVSTYDILGRAVAAFSADAAAELTDNAEGHAETANWRSDFWKGVWREVHASPMTTVFGLGYGFPLWSLHATDLTDSPVRTPHSIFMFVLGYSGWLGVVVFAGVQASLARLLWRVYRTTGEPFGFCLWSLTIIWAMIDPLLETPFGAVPLFMLMGMSAAPLIQQEMTSERSKVAREMTRSPAALARSGAAWIRRPELGSS